MQSTHSNVLCVKILVIFILVSSTENLLFCRNPSEVRPDPIANAPSHQVTILDDGVIVITPFRNDVKVAAVIDEVMRANFNAVTEKTPSDIASKNNSSHDVSHKHYPDDVSKKQHPDNVSHKQSPAAGGMKSAAAQTLLEMGFSSELVMDVLKDTSQEVTTELLCEQALLMAAARQQKESAGNSAVTTPRTKRKPTGSTGMTVMTGNRDFLKNNTRIIARKSDQLHENRNTPANSGENSSEEQPLLPSDFHL
jgi:hypothetical protein